MDAGTPVYTDFSGLAELRSRAAGNRPGTVPEVARQFESLLMGQMIKSMRQASLGDGVLDNEQSRFYRDLFDQQLALHLAEHGGMGLAAAIERQLGAEQPPETAVGRDIGEYTRITLRPLRAEGGRGRSDESPDSAADDRSGAVEGSVASGRVNQEENPDRWEAGDFVEQLWPWALEAAGMLGLEPQALLAQAALETGWGRHIMRRRDGTPSHNLFGIKAGKGWQGKQVTVGSLEYEQGVAVRKRSAFRAYDSFRDSFRDYVDFLRSNPRYHEALNSTDSSRRYFTSLQKAGYATDPDYADKIDAVLQSKDMQRALAGFKGSGSQPL